jgi:hypothetical protein
VLRIDIIALAVLLWVQAGRLAVDELIALQQPAVLARLKAPAITADREGFAMAGRGSCHDDT